MQKRNIIAILRGVSPDQVCDIAQVLLDAGITTIEVPLNSPNPYDSIGALVDSFGDRALIGAGTVLSVKQVKQVHALGAGLIVSPDCNPLVIAASKDHALQSFPGVFTPTECFAALRAGADGLKFFPGALLGPSGLAAILAVLPKGTKTYAVGGAGPDNFAKWQRAGVTGFGLGTALYQAGDGLGVVGTRAAQVVAAYDLAMGVPS